MLRSGIHLAESDAEKEAVYRLRYDVYVQEMGRFGATRIMRSAGSPTPRMRPGRIYYAAEGGRVIATSRFSWGGDFYHAQAERSESAG
jgi:hypothetical protein